MVRIPNFRILIDNNKADPCETLTGLAKWFLDWCMRFDEIFFFEYVICDGFKLKMYIFSNLKKHRTYLRNWRILFNRKSEKFVKTHASV